MQCCYWSFGQTEVVKCGKSNMHRLTFSYALFHKQQLSVNCEMKTKTAALWQLIWTRLYAPLFPVLIFSACDSCLYLFSLAGLLINVWWWNLLSPTLYWKGSVLLGNVNVWVSAFYRKRTILLTWWQIHLGNCKEDVTAVLHSNTWMTRAALSSSPVSISLQTKNLKTTAEEDVPPTRCFWIRMH